jgi:hypothetical protein
MIAREELRGVRTDVKAIRSELDELRDKVDNIAGYRKEIDHALERIAAIRKHLGLNKKIAGEAGTTRSSPAPAERQGTGPSLRSGRSSRPNRLATRRVSNLLRRRGCRQRTRRTRLRRNKFPSAMTRHLRPGNVQVFGRLHDTRSARADGRRSKTCTQTDIRSRQPQRPLLSMSCSKAGRASRAVSRMAASGQICGPDC